MDNNDKDKFQEQLQAAISSSLRTGQATDSLRERLRQRLQEESVQLEALPEGVSEPAVSDFEARLSEAVERASEWSPEDAAVLRTEARVSYELGRDVFSERSLHAVVDGESAEGISEQKLRYVGAYRQAIAQSISAATAPDSLRERVAEAIRREAAALESGMKADTTPLQPQESSRKVIPINPWRKRFKKAAGWGMSLAASFAIVFVLFFSGAEAAIANDVQRDHQHCAGMVKETSTPRVGFAEKIKEIYGEVPAPPVDDSWTLKMNNLCPNENGVKMVHYVYARTNAQGEEETLSLHFIPPARDSRDMKAGQPKKLHEIKGDFAILGWTQGYWTCTVCSPDVDVDTLRKSVAGLGL